MLGWPGSALGLSALQPLPAANFWRVLSSGLVMVGFAMLLGQFLLSGRLGCRHAPPHQLKAPRTNM